MQKLHENYIVIPYKMKKNMPLRFAKVIYDWETNDVLKFISEEHNAEYCEYYDLAALSGSNTRVGIPLHAVAIRRLGDVVATEPDFYDRLYECFPHIEAQRRWWSEYDLDKRILQYSRGGWNGENIVTPGLQKRAFAFAAEFRKKHVRDARSYPLHLLVRNLLIHEFHITSVNPIGPGTRAFTMQQEEELLN